MPRKKRTSSSVRSGYPKTKKFTTAEAVEEYFSKPKIQCLLCGYRFNALHTHLRRTHDCSADEYKEKYGLPTSIGLVGRAIKKRKRKKYESHRDKWEEAKKNAPPVVVKAKSAKAKKEGTKQWQKKDYIEFIRRIRTYRTIAEVSSDEDMPTRLTFINAIETDSVLKKCFDDAWEELPNRLQVRAHRISKRLEFELVTLRDEGVPWSQIGKTLGISKSTCRFIYTRAMKEKELELELQEQNEKLLTTGNIYTKLRGFFGAKLQND